MLALKKKKVGTVNQLLDCLPNMYEILNLTLAPHKVNMKKMFVLNQWPPQTWTFAHPYTNTYICVSHTQSFIQIISIKLTFCFIAAF